MFLFSEIEYNNNLHIIIIMFTCSSTVKLTLIIKGVVQMLTGHFYFDEPRGTGRRQLIGQ